MTRLGKGLALDQKSAWNAWEKGNAEFEKSNGENLDLLIDATDYLDNAGESGIMEDAEYEKQLIEKIPTIDYLEENVGTISKRSPIAIPKDATYVVQEKNGYKQIKYTWESGGYKYTSRWHTRTPGAPKEQGVSWVVERRIPGIGYGENHRDAQEEVFVGGNEWISKATWKEAIIAKSNGTATKQQKEWLDNGHWEDK